MSKGRQYTDEWFISKGFLKQADGSYAPPPIKSRFINDLKSSAELVVKEKVNNSPDFEIKSPVTEWFIKGWSVPSKKNSRQNFVTKDGRQLSIPSKKHAEYVKMTGMQYEVFGREFRNAVNFYGLQYPLHVEFNFIRGTKHSFDFGNALQTCEDIMKDEVKKGVLIKKGWFPDDSADYIIPVFKPYEIDKGMPGVRIRLVKEVIIKYF